MIPLPSDELEEVTRLWSKSPRYAAVLAFLLLGMLLPTAEAAAGEPLDERAAKPDFDGNGSTDLFWYAPGPAADQIWQWDGEQFQVVPTSVSGTYQQLVVDVDGDGATDVFWYAPGSRPDYLWRSTPSGFVSSAVSVTGTYQPLVVDFDGNGAEEIFWYAPGSRADYLWTWNSSGFTSRPLGVLGSYQPIVADFDGTGSTEVFWYAPGPARDYLWTWQDDRFVSRQFPVGGSYRPFTADVDGDRDDEIIWYAPGSARDYRWDLVEGQMSSTVEVIGGDHQTHVGDFDADGVDEVLLYTDGPADDLLWNLDATGAEPALQLLADPGPGHTVRGGDFDGDGFDDLILAPSNDTAVTWWRGTPTTFEVRAVDPDGSVRVAEPNPRTPYSSTHVVNGRTITINAFLPVGSAAGVTLLHPGWIVERVGWHQAYAGNQPTEMTPAPTAISDFVLPSRGRGTGSHTAADIPVDPSSAVWAAESGVVARAGTYYLQDSSGRLHLDVFVVIRPDSNPDKEVTMLHMVGQRVQPGDRVESGVTIVADHSRKFPFVSQVDDYTASPSWPHVHLEIRNYKGSSGASPAGGVPADVVPNTPSGTADPTWCEHEDSGAPGPCGDD